MMHALQSRGELGGMPLLDNAASQLALRGAVCETEAAASEAVWRAVQAMARAEAAERLVLEQRAFAEQQFASLAARVDAASVLVLLPNRRCRPEFWKRKTV